MDLSPKANETHAKIKHETKLNLYAFAEQMIIKIKRQCIEWDKIFANDMTNKGLLSKVYFDYLFLFYLY